MLRKLVPVLFLLLPRLLYGFEWPVEEKMLTVTFGEYTWDCFHPGIDIGGGAQDVHPAEAGELIYYAEEHEGFHALPSGLGSFAVLEHDRGLRTLYGHLQPGTLRTDRDILEEGDILARVGNSGMTVGPRLHFQVIDREFDQLVNPLLILPPLKDTTKPVLEALYLLKNRSRIELQDRATVTSGTYELLAAIYDPSEYVRYFRPMNPFKIQVFLNGEQVVYTSFEALQHEDGEMVLIQSSDADCDELYYPDGTMRLGSLQFSPGDIMIEILAEDILRNGITEEFRIRVTE